MSREGDLSKCDIHKGGEGGEDDEGDDEPSLMVTLVTKLVENLGARCQSVKIW